MNTRLHITPTRVRPSYSKRQQLNHPVRYSSMELRTHILGNYGSEIELFPNRYHDGNDFSLTNSLSIFLPLTHTYSHSLSGFLSLTHISQTHSLSFSLSHIHTHTHSLSFPLTHTHTHIHSVSLNLSLCLSPALCFRPSLCPSPPTSLLSLTPSLSLRLFTSPLLRLELVI